MTMVKVDLHLHSTCSDGIYPPAEVVRRAAEAGMAAIAIADHDNIDGIDEAQDAGQKLGVTVLSAVELSSQWESYHDIHLLGYGFDHHDQELQTELKKFQEFRSGRNLEIIERVNLKLAQEGRAPLDPDDVKRKAGGTIGRPHIAQALLEAGCVDGNDAAFDRYLVPCNVPKRYFPLDQAIELIHGCGGVAVLAHPPYITRDRFELEQLVKLFVTFDLDGIEAYNNGASLEDIDWTIKLARKYKLIVTGGSDYHGTKGSEVEIGCGFGRLSIPFSCVEEICQARQRRHGLCSA
ncbi:MAG TPA: PHP domain-containing protein [Geopsychrobacteraceae bacterium]|nr:PHP domain-containing protein [Geopsychrobacteraceae bacterium]